MLRIYTNPKRITQVMELDQHKQIIAAALARNPRITVLQWINEAITARLECLAGCDRECHQGKHNNTEVE